MSDSYPKSSAVGSVASGAVLDDDDLHLESTYIPALQHTISYALRSAGASRYEFVTPFQFRVQNSRQKSNQVRERVALDQGEVSDCARRGDGRHLRAAGSHRAVQVARWEASMN